jgi:hypothetical protein
MTSASQAFLIYPFMLWLNLAYNYFLVWQQWVATLPKTDQKNFLPPGYQSKNPNPKAVQMVDRIIRDYVKTDKGILRGCVSFPLDIQLDSFLSAGMY